MFDKLNFPKNELLPQQTVTVPDYLEKNYWWAYTHPNSVRIFERQWLVNLILWGNLAKLRNVVLAERAECFEGHILQIACVYGDFTEHIIRCLAPDAQLNVIDVAPVQILNLQEKLSKLSALTNVIQKQVTVSQQDACALLFENDSQDTTVLFFLLHEQPLEVRKKTIAEAIRVTKPNGKLIFVDYHRPHVANVLRYVMAPILATLEPFAMDLWCTDIAEYLPPSSKVLHMTKRTYFGGLYQCVVLTC